MRKSKKNRKKYNKKILTVSLASVAVIAGSIIIFTAFNKSNPDSVKKSNENLSTNENVSNNKLEYVSATQNEIDNKSENSADLTSESKIYAENKNSVDNVDKMPSGASQNKTGTDFSAWNNSCDSNLIVVNKDNTIPANYNSNIIDYKSIKVNATAKDSLDNMINAAAKEGLKIYPSSGYRSVARQTTLFNNQVSRCKKQGYKSEKAEVMAATVVAKPGTSEHHTGFAIDFNGVRDDFYKTKEYSWLMENAADYGFILRYPKNKTDITNVIYEPWHFRYVGKEHAQKIAQSGLCLEEYIESIMKK